MKNMRVIAEQHRGGDIFRIPVFLSFINFMISSALLSNQVKSPVLPRFEIKTFNKVKSKSYKDASSSFEIGKKKHASW